MNLRAGMALGMVLLAVGTVSCSSPAEIEVSLNCPSVVDDRVDLGTYLANSAVDGGPPNCTIVATGGRQPYSGQVVTINGVPAPTPITLDATQPSFVLPPQTTGIHEVRFELRDASGKQGAGTTRLEWGWASAYGAGVQLESVVLGTDQLIEIEHRVNFDIVPITAHPRLFPAITLDEQYVLTIDFGDGMRWSRSYTDFQADEFVRHNYPKGANYIARVTVEGSQYGQTATASIHIRDDGVSGVTLYNPELMDVEWQLVNTELPAQLHTIKTENTFDDPQYNRTTVTDATVFGGQEGIYQVDIARIVHPILMRPTQRNAATLKIGPIPTVLVTGQSLSLDIQPKVTLHEGSTLTVYTAGVRIFATRQKPPDFGNLGVGTHELQVPLPVHASDLITIELQIESDLLDQVLLMRWTYAHSE